MMSLFLAAVIILWLEAEGLSHSDNLRNFIRGSFKSFILQILSNNVPSRKYLDELLQKFFQIPHRFGRNLLEGFPQLFLYVFLHKSVHSFFKQIIYGFLRTFSSDFFKQIFQRFYKILLTFQQKFFQAFLYKIFWRILLKFLQSSFFDFFCRETLEGFFHKIIYELL